MFLVSSPSFSLVCSLSMGCLVTSIFTLLLSLTYQIDAFDPSTRGIISPSSSLAVKRGDPRTTRPIGRRRRPSSSNRTTRNDPDTIKRAPHQFDHKEAIARPFVDALAEIKHQEPNHGALPFDLRRALNDTTTSPAPIDHAHVTSYGLDDLFPGLSFSSTFAESTAFRVALRDAIRRDVFDTTPTYHGLSEKAQSFLLLPDSSLQGSWKCKNGGWRSDGSAAKDATTQNRMQRVTDVLQEYLGSKSPSGDDFMDTIGKLCGPKATTHWMDIVGVPSRRIAHSWHQDIGANEAKTVLFGFPPSDHYDGVGVFSHLVKLKDEQRRGDGNKAAVLNEPVLFPTVAEAIESDYIVRPLFSLGNELIVYRDIDVLHSSPDIAHRTSVMRFM